MRLINKVIKFEGLDDPDFKDRYFFLSRYDVETELFDQVSVTVSFYLPAHKHYSLAQLGLSFEAEVEIDNDKFKLSCPESIHIQPESRVTDNVTIVFKKLERIKSLGEIAMEQFNKRAKDFLHELFDEDSNKRESAHILTPKISNIYVNEKKQTIVIKWQTGEITKVTCMKGDKWDLEKGIMAAITKYVLGNNYNAGNILSKYVKSVKETN